MDAIVLHDQATIKKSLDTLHSSQAEEYSEDRCRPFVRAPTLGLSSVKWKESKEQIAWLSRLLAMPSAAWTVPGLPASDVIPRQLFGPKRKPSCPAPGSLACSRQSCFRDKPPEAHSFEMWAKW